MAISGVNPKCYILALFVRDDGARFLLGDDPFEFKDNQLHFQQNTMANDVVEVQGNDGYLLAGQVRRPGTQVFDGYVCNGTNSKEEVEVKRRAFLQFFRRSHFYKVIYVFPNGTAIQRKQGFLVDDPTVQELYQQYPEYHVALNFEDVNYYTYEEDDQGQEIYAKEAIVPLAGGGATGGLIWDEHGVVWEDPWSLPLSISGVQFQVLNNAGARAPIENVELYGDTYQQTYSGKNLLPFTNQDFTVKNIHCYVSNGSLYFDGTSSGEAYTSNVAWKNNFSFTLQSGTYTISNQSGFTSACRIRRFSDDENLTQDVTATATSRTFTLAEETKVYFGFYIHNVVCSNTKIVVQLELGSTPTPYEPYVGGIPAPNPDYPETVNVVSGVQNVWVHGKNLFPLGTGSYTNHGLTSVYNADGSITVSGTADATYADLTASRTVNYEQGKTYTASITEALPINFGVIALGAGVRREDIIIAAGTKSGKRTFDYTHNKTKLYIYNLTVGQSYNFTIYPMLEYGSTVSPFEPYQSQSYTIDLGSTELCKIGDYQDYIYKSGDDWYVHKEIAKITFSGDVSETWVYNSGSAYPFRYNLADADQLAESQAYAPNVVVNYYTPFAWNISTRPDYGVTAVAVDRNLCFRNVDMTSLDAWKTWLASHNTTLYYPLATPNDTKITDATLVGQLEALGAMKLFIGENNGLVSATEPNLPATLAFDYYTKFATIGAEWEEGGTKGATIVNVDAIDNTYPVWELTGPATNPTLSVLTTNTALTYNGTITGSQKLVIDMFNKTATLNGTSVIGNISGDFVYMAPGTNRLAYTAGNTDAPDSTIYWQEVVG